jgi:protein arginine kinase activator
LLAQLEALAAEEIKKKPPSKKSKSAKSLTGKAAKLGKVAANLEELDQRTCPHCGITYREFRQKGRLGCPHDYDFFAIELEPLLYNIHGKKEHLGKRPQEGARTAQQQTELVRLKREMQAAVEREDYELAARLRDQIRKQEG